MRIVFEKGERTTLIITNLVFIIFSIVALSALCTEEVSKFTKEKVESAYYPSYDSSGDTVQD